jgi:uncharacterized protein YhfF
MRRRLGPALRHRSPGTPRVGVHPADRTAVPGQPLQQVRGGRGAVVPGQRGGDRSRALADELIDLVLAGTERATAALVADFVHEGEPLPRVGGHRVACDGDGVDDAFARDEGEDDRTRAGRLRGHLRDFTRTLAARGEPWADDLEVVSERSCVVWPPEVADPA